MASSILLIFQAMRDALRDLFHNDLDVLSQDMKDILSNPDDAKAYKEAVDAIKNGAEEKTVKLSNNREFTLIR